MTQSVTETIYRSCPTCEASCGLVLEVDQEARQVISIKGDAEDARSRGYVCAKSQAFNYIHEDPERLRTPVRRTADGWQSISWEEALNEVGERLRGIRQEYGKDAIAMYYGNPNGHNFNTQIYTELFINMLNTERFFSAGSVDQQPKNLACELLYGNAWLIPVPDLEHTDFLVCMGGNPLVSQGSLLGAPDIKARLQELHERGGRTVVLDPRRTETAEVAQQHLFIRPGSDAFLLLAWVNELFSNDWVTVGALAPIVDGVAELRQLVAPYTAANVAAVTGIDAATIRQLVADFHGAEKPVLYGRIGLCTQEFGTVASWLVEVINILSGRLDVPGGSMIARPATGQNEPLPHQPLKHGRWKSRARGFPEYMGMLPASLMAEELSCEGTDAVHALITVAGNPVLSVPNGKAIRTAMDKLDFVVALDFYINETTAAADIILPSTTQLEHSNYDFLFSAFCQRNFARYSPQVFAAPDDSREQYELLLELAARMNGMAAGDLNAMMLDGMLAQICAAAADPEARAEQIKAATEQYRDSERFLDILLRLGPYGDQFGDNPDGLTLAKVSAAEHGIDLGPLQSMLPHALRTENKRINLVPTLIVDDLPRAALALQRPLPDLVMVGRRHIRDMNSWLHNLLPYARGKNRCTLLVSPQDAARLDLQAGEQAQITTAVGSQVLEVAVSDEMMPGVVSFPHGFGHTYADSGQSTARERLPGVSANDLVDETLDVPSGTSVVNGVPVSVQPVTGVT
jgi:anaerobic selenocysteine-containing dehydrogenase